MGNKTVKTSGLSENQFISYGDNPYKIGDSFHTGNMKGAVSKIEQFHNIYKITIS